MSEVDDCVILDDDPPATTTEMTKTRDDKNAKSGTTDFDDGSGTENLCLSDMQVLDEVKGDDSSDETNINSQEKYKNNEQVKDESSKTRNADTANGKAEALNTDPYAYLNQGNFSSENFKIELKGLPKYFGIAELKKLLNDTLKLGSNKIKPPRNGNHLFVCFRSEESKMQALEVLNGYTWKNAKLYAMPAKAAPDPLVRKRKLEVENQEGKKVSKVDIDPAEKILQSTIPYWDIPYETQLENKMESMRKLLKQMGDQLSKTHPGILGWLKEQQQKYDGLPCELQPIRSSPLIDGYRNKCEFTVGLHPATKAPTVGFRLGSYASGEVNVYPPDGLQHIPEVMKKVAKEFESLVTSSPYPPFNPEQRKGVWQTLAVRTTLKGQLMLRVVVHVEEMTTIEINALKNDVKEFFVLGAGKEFNVDSLFFHPVIPRKKGESLPPPELLHGEPYIFEELMGVKLRISPMAFFQINTPAAEVLYSTVAELAHTTPDTTLLDICCGTGSIGLCLAKEFGQVLGVELEQSAVSDAKANATANGLTHCDFFAGTAESILGSVIVRASLPNFVAVLDPPRPGIGNKVITTIRRCQQIKRLVYMACNPTAAMSNFRDLARPASKTVSGHPFLPVCAIPVDLFPHTPHCELVVLLERFDPATLPPSPAGGIQIDIKEEGQPPQGKKRNRKRGPRNTANKFTENCQTLTKQPNKGPNDAQMNNAYLNRGGPASFGMNLAGIGRGMDLMRPYAGQGNQRPLSNFHMREKQIPRPGPIFNNRESLANQPNRGPSNALMKNTHNIANNIADLNREGPVMGIGRGVDVWKAFAQQEYQQTGPNFNNKEGQMSGNKRPRTEFDNIDDETPQHLRATPSLLQEPKQKREPWEKEMCQMSFENGHIIYRSKERFPKSDQRMNRSSELPASISNAAQEAAVQLGHSWGSQVNASMLFDEEALRKEEEIAVRKFKETFAEAIKGKRAAYEADNERKNQETFSRPSSNYNNAPSTQVSGNEGEKMIPLSAVSKLLQTILDQEKKTPESSGIRDQSQFSETRVDNKHTREVYVENQIWKGHDDDNHDKREVCFLRESKSFSGDRNNIPSSSTKPLISCLKKPLLPPPVSIYRAGLDAEDSRLLRNHLHPSHLQKNTGNFSARELKQPVLEQHGELKFWQGEKTRPIHNEVDTGSCGQEPWPYGNPMEESGSSPTNDFKTPRTPSPPRLYDNDFPSSINKIANSRGLSRTPFQLQSNRRTIEPLMDSNRFEKRTESAGPSFGQRGSSRGGRCVDVRGLDWLQQQMDKKPNVATNMPPIRNFQKRNESAGPSFGHRGSFRGGRSVSVQKWSLPNKQPCVAAMSPQSLCPPLLNPRWSQGPSNSNQWQQSWSNNNSQMWSQQQQEYKWG